MHFHITDAYQAGGSRLHRMDARIKLLLCIGLILLLGLTPIGRFGAYIGFFALAMIGALSARIDPWLVMKRSVVALPFTLAAITLLFTVPGPTLITLPLTGWTISTLGLIRFISILLKSMISVQFAVLLIFTTQLTDTLWALGALHAPQILVSIISFMYRYIFLLADESLRMTRARDSRSAVIAEGRKVGQSIIFDARTTGRMIGSLFLRSFERSERIYQAMIARGYAGQIRQFMPPPIPRADWVIAGLAIMVGVGLLLVSLIL
jgi:cobalt/nickel transport system permease protein